MGCVLVVNTSSITNGVTEMSLNENAYTWKGHTDFQPRFPAKLIMDLRAYSNELTR